MAQRKHRSKRTKPGANEEEKRHIPIDIYEEILFRLPAGDLLNCKCVCKDWLRLISSPGFIYKHLMSRSNAGRNETRILMPLPSDQIIDYNYDGSGGNNNISKKIPYPPGFSGKNTIILGSCDGLICLLDEGSRKLALYNPSTRKSNIHKVEELNSNMSTCCYWFGHHPSSGEYVLVVGRLDFRGPSDHAIDVYRLSCKLKSVLSCSIPGPVCCFREVGILLHGNLHWPAAAKVPFLDKPGFGLMVLAYDFQENKILKISPPRKAYFRLGVVDGCLSAVFSAGEMFEVWILREYGVGQPWTKYGNIEGYGKSCSLLSPVVFLRNGDLILVADRSKLIKYSFGDKKAMLLEDHNSRLYCGAFVCVDSLVSPALILGE